MGYHWAFTEMAFSELALKCFILSGSLRKVLKLLHPSLVTALAAAFQTMHLAELGQAILPGTVPML